MKLIILEGPDNVGKTYLSKVFTNFLKKFTSYKVRSIHFPSEDLCASKEFQALLKPHTGIKIEKKFIDILIKEEQRALNKAKSDGVNIFVIDRMMLSSMAYQGKKSPKMMEYILRRYGQLFIDCDIRVSDISHHILMTEMGKENDVSNVTKREFDEKNIEFRNSYKEILYRISVNSIRSSFLENTYVYDFDRIIANDVVSEFEKEIITIKMIQDLMKFIK